MDSCAPPLCIQSAFLTSTQDKQEGKESRLDPHLKRNCNTQASQARKIICWLQGHDRQPVPEKAALVSAGIALIYLLVADAVLCFDFGVRIMLITH